MQISIFVQKREQKRGNLTQAPINFLELTFGCIWRISTWNLSKVLIYVFQVCFSSMFFTYVFQVFLFYYMFDMFCIVFFNDEEIKCIELNWIELWRKQRVFAWKLLWMDEFS